MHNFSNKKNTSFKFLEDKNYLINKLQISFQISSSGLSKGSIINLDFDFIDEKNNVPIPLVVFINFFFYLVFIVVGDLS